MANEKRLIDAYDVISYLRKLLDKNQRFKDTYSYKAFEIVLQRLQDEPVVDAVEVVRCKDCKHYKPQKVSAKWDGKTNFCCRVVTVKVPPDGFCSYGERRKEDV